MDMLPGLITAFVAPIAAVGAIFQNRAGRRDSARQAAAARELERREQLFTESEAALEAHKALGETYREEIARVNAARESERTRYEEAHARKDQRIDNLLAELQQNRRDCSAARKELASTVTLLSNAIRGDVHLEMVKLALGLDEEHDQTVHKTRINDPEG